MGSREAVAMVKIDLITGFLGAGKTTFIKKMIEEAFVGEKLVLIENEFGEVGIDGGFLKDSGIEKHITFHCFRHTFATLQLAEGTDIYTVSKLLTHSNLATTQVYADVVDELKRDAAERISLKIPTKEESDQT